MQTMLLSLKVSLKACKLTSEEWFVPGLKPNRFLHSFFSVGIFKFPTNKKTSRDIQRRRLFQRPCPKVRLRVPGGTSLNDLNLFVSEASLGWYTAQLAQCPNRTLDPENALHGYIQDEHF